MAANHNCLSFKPTAVAKVAHAPRIMFALFVWAMIIHLLRLSQICLSLVSLLIYRHAIILPICCLLIYHLSLSIQSFLQQINCDRVPIKGKVKMNLFFLGWLRSFHWSWISVSGEAIPWETGVLNNLLVGLLVFRCHPQ